jgi:hypothetical protein
VSTYDNCKFFTGSIEKVQFLGARATTTASVPTTGHTLEVCIGAKCQEPVY